MKHPYNGIVCHHPRRNYIRLRPRDSVLRCASSQFNAARGRGLQLSVRQWQALVGSLDEGYYLGI